MKACLIIINLLILVTGSAVRSLVMFCFERSGSQVWLSVESLRKITFQNWLEPGCAEKNLRFYVIVCQNHWRSTVKGCIDLAKTIVFAKNTKHCYSDVMLGHWNIRSKMTNYLCLLLAIGLVRSNCTILYHCIYYINNINVYFLYWKCKNTFIFIKSFIQNVLLRRSGTMLRARSYTVTSRRNNATDLLLHATAYYSTEYYVGVLQRALYTDKL